MVFSSCLKKSPMRVSDGDSTLVSPVKSGSS